MFKDYYIMFVLEGWYEQKKTQVEKTKQSIGFGLQQLAGRAKFFTHQQPTISLQLV